jgi:hypothetical protein
MWHELSGRGAVVPTDTLKSQEGPSVVYWSDGSIALYEGLCQNHLLLESIPYMNVQVLFEKAWALRRCGTDEITPICAIVSVHWGCFVCLNA